MADKNNSIFSVAYWFTNICGSVHSKKLQKLCYYTQAWSYALNDGPFFKGEFEAWVHGPVNRELWTRFRDIAYREITISDFCNTDKIDFSAKETDFLQLVWNTYGDFSGFELEEMTHNETPWQEQRIGLDLYQPSHNIIRTDTMKTYYRSLLAQDGVI